MHVFIQAHQVKLIIGLLTVFKYLKVKLIFRTIIAKGKCNDKLPQRIII